MTFKDLKKILDQQLEEQTVLEEEAVLDYLIY
jgi:hypothetical protein